MPFTLNSHRSPFWAGNFSGFPVFADASRVSLVHVVGTFALISGRCDSLRTTIPLSRKKTQLYSIM